MLSPHLPLTYIALARQGAVSIAVYHLLLPLETRWAVASNGKVNERLCVIFCCPLVPS